LFLSKKLLLQKKTVFKLEDYVLDSVYGGGGTLKCITYGCGPPDGNTSFTCTKMY